MPAPERVTMVRVGVRLRASFCECGQVLIVFAEVAEGFAIDTDEAIEWLRFAGPVAGGLVGEVIGERPDAEVGIVGDQGMWAGARSGAWALAVSGSMATRHGTTTDVARRKKAMADHPK